MSCTTFMGSSSTRNPTVNDVTILVAMFSRLGFAERDNFNKLRVDALLYDDRLSAANICDRHTKNGIKQKDQADLQKEAHAQVCVGGPRQTTFGLRAAMQTAGDENSGHKHANSRQDAVEGQLGSANNRNGVFRETV